jgi:hypothetical protein
MKPARYLESAATLSPDGRHRYELWRRWAGGPVLNVIGLNPSSADADRDDPTTRRCVGLARRAGFGGLVLTNLFGLRATDPAQLRQGARPTGVDNDLWIERSACSADSVVVAWGRVPRRGGGPARPREAIDDELGHRAANVLRLLDGAGVRPFCFGINRDGSPRHPLYLPASTVLRPYRPRLAPGTSRPAGGPAALRAGDA